MSHDWEGLWVGPDRHRPDDETLCVPPGPPPCPLTHSPCARPPLALMPQVLCVRCGGGRCRAGRALLLPELADRGRVSPTGNSPVGLPCPLHPPPCPDPPWGAAWGYGSMGRELGRACSAAVTSWAREPCNKACPVSEQGQAPAPTPHTDSWAHKPPMGTGRGLHGEALLTTGSLVSVHNSATCAWVAMRVAGVAGSAVQPSAPK